ncbi:MAG: acyltransferase [Fimbriimonadaceae bacterium]|nr:acyltransferase [Fimbriimonadaceae bacterium]
MPRAGAVPRKKVVFPHLDGLRFFCFLAVFLFHAFHTDASQIKQSEAYRVARQLVRHGDLGVNFFFVLSGFLITYLLLEEKRWCGEIHIGYFYLRRILRIWPLYMACIALGFLGFPVLKQAVGLEPSETANPIMYLLFLGNFDVISNGLPDAGILGVLWSVAVEEQFYFVWPILLAAVPLGRELWILLSILATSLIFRAIQTNDAVLTFHTAGLIGDMAVGGLAAYASIRSGSFVEWVAGARGAALWLLYGLTALVFFLDSRFLRPFDRLVPAIVFAAVILEQNYSRASPFKAGAFPLLSRLGQRTYGMYCLHMVGNVAAIQLARSLGLGGAVWHVLLAIPLTSLTITLLISELSYRYFELRFLGWKSRFQFISRE